MTFIALNNYLFFAFQHLIMYPNIKSIESGLLQIHLCDIFRLRRCRGEPQRFQEDETLYHNGQKKTGGELGGLTQFKNTLDMRLMQTAFGMISCRL